MTTAVDVPPAQLRVGEVAELTGTTPRTIRYYEEIGLLPAQGHRAKGVHRLYTAEDVERIREVMRLRDLLGLSLEQLSTLIEVESVRRHLRNEWAGATGVAHRQRILAAALQCADTQLALVHRRQEQLDQLEGEVRARRATIESRLRDLPTNTESAARQRRLFGTDPGGVRPSKDPGRRRDASCHDQRDDERIDDLNVEQERGADDSTGQHRGHRDEAAPGS
jgi:DNA-binding transcriptional MerR regulator